MTPKEIIETVAVRFPLLLYQGYAATEEPQADGDGNPVLWPRELKAALRAYGSKTGVLGSMEVEAVEVHPQNRTAELPPDFLALNMCVDSLGTYVKTKVERDPEGGKALKLISAGREGISYPVKVSYFIRLTDYIDSDAELPPECDCGLICDYLEALIGEVNAQYNSALESFDLQAGQKTRAEYQEQKKHCEAEFGRQRKLPGIAIA